MVSWGRGVTFQVAVKTLKESAADKEKKDLQHELAVMKMLDPHPNVVRLLGCCTEKDPIFVILEFVSGGTLQVYHIPKCPIAIVWRIGHALFLCNFSGITWEITTEKVGLPRRGLKVKKILTSHFGFRTSCESRGQSTITETFTGSLKPSTLVISLVSHTRYAQLMYYRLVHCTYQL